MTWEETIKMIRTKEEFDFLVEKAYFDEDLTLNVDRFKNSDEFLETLKIITEYAPNAKHILDVGSGNGISAVSFALLGYEVCATEPDISTTIGAGAIELLKEHYRLNNLTIRISFAEDLESNNNLFDVIYVRQAMHHAKNLTNFIKNLSSLLKKGGILITIRDHVILNKEDKEWFLLTHPLHKYYGGENAYTELEYKNAFNNANLKIVKHLRYYDSVINYFPLTKTDLIIETNDYKKHLLKKLKNKIGVLSKIKVIQDFLFYYKLKNYFDETKVPGRMHSFIAIK